MILLFRPQYDRCLVAASSQRLGPTAAMLIAMLVLLVGPANAVMAQATMPSEPPQSAELEEANHLSQLAEKLNGEGKYTEAIPLAEQALATFEKALGTAHVRVAQSLNDLAVLYRSMGDYARAEPLCLRALAIREQALGAEHPDVASTLNNLANLYRSKTDYARAETLYQRALAIREKALGAEHPDVALSLNNLALLYREKGDYARAEQLHLRALAIWEKALGPEHPDVALSLNNLGLMYFKIGDYARAEPLYERALAIREKVLQPNHPFIATSVNNLANLYKEKGDYARAGPLYQRALAIWEKALGPEHRIVASSLNDIANFYRDTGDYAKAEPLYLRALDIREKAIGPEHPAVALLLSDLAVLYSAKGETTRAIQLMRRANEIREHKLALVLTTGSEEQKRLYLETLSDETDATISLHIQSAPNDPEAARLALTNILRRKGRVLDAMSDQLGTLRHRLAPEDRALLDQFSAARAHLATLVLNDAGKDTPAQHQAAIATVSAEVERLEAAVGVRSAEFRAGAQAVALETVQAALPADTALIELVWYRPFNPKAGKRDERFAAPHYVAYVLKREGAPRWVELGDAASIDADVSRLRGALGDARSANVKQLARALDEKVMRPVRPLLGDATRLLVSPDGELNLIPFEALVDEHEQGTYLIERYSFTYLTSGRDLLRMQAARTSSDESPTIASPLVVANPLFGEPAHEQIASMGRPAIRRLRSVTAARSLSEVYFAPLSATAGEAGTIKKLFSDANLLTADQATESALKQTAAPRLLHVATHGFFLEDAGAATARTPQPMRGLRANIKIENPLLRSGLALAGANRHSSTDDDGILTALEASGLNLWGTKLVVLSACDTGLGEIRNGEGVFGLRRAFVLAGAESLVMSLWPVSDYPTKKLMTAFYNNLKHGMGRGEALRQAQLSMVKEKLHPFYWANFIQSGEWANLDGQR